MLALANTARYMQPELALGGVMWIRQCQQSPRGHSGEFWVNCSFKTNIATVFIVHIVFYRHKFSECLVFPTTRFPLW